MILIAVSLYPTIKKLTQEVSYTNSSLPQGMPQTILGITPIFFLIAVIGVALIPIYFMFKNNKEGIEDTNEDSEEEESSEIKVESKVIQKPKKVESRYENKVTEIVEPIFSNEKSRFEKRSKYD